MAWTDDVVDWLKDEGIKIAIWLVIGIVALIIWGIICNFFIKALTVSGIKTREAVLRSKYTAAQGAGIGGKFAKSAMKRIISKDKNKTNDNDNNIAATTATTTTTNDNDNNDDNDIKSNETGKLIDGENNNVQNNIEAIDAELPETNLAHKLKDIKLNEDEIYAMKQRAKTIGGVIRSVGNVIILIIMFVSILDIVGIPTTALMGCAALIGFALALAAETIIGDFVGGMFILAENQYFQGETVIINDIEGVVENLSLRTTTIRGDDGKLYTIPNGEIRIVSNASRDFAIAEITITIPYSGEKDYTMVKDCLQNIVANEISNDNSFNNRFILEAPQITSVSALGDNAIVLKYGAKVKPDTSDDVRDVMIKHIRLQFPKQNIPIKSIT